MLKATNKVRETNAEQLMERNFFFFVRYADSAVTSYLGAGGVGVKSADPQTSFGNFCFRLLPINFDKTFPALLSSQIKSTMHIMEKLQVGAGGNMCE